MNLKEVVGKKAVEYVKDGMIVGLGTGSTVFYFVHALADRVKEGLNVEMVSTSIQTVELAKSLGLSIKDLEEIDHIDLAVIRVAPSFNLNTGFRPTFSIFLIV